MALAVGHRQNFNTLQQAFFAGDVALMECQLAATGEVVPVLCAANRQRDGSLEFAPFVHRQPLRNLEPAQTGGRILHAGAGLGRVAEIKIGLYDQGNRGTKMGLTIHYELRANTRSPQKVIPASV